MSIIRDLTAIDVPVPKPILEAEATRHAVTAALADSSELSVFIQRLESGAITPNLVAKELHDVGQALSRRHALEGRREEFAVALGKLERAAIAASAAELYETMRPLVVTAGANLAAAIKVVGVEPDAKVVRTLGADAGRNLDLFDDSVRLLRRVKEVVQQLSGQIVSRTVQRFVDLSPATWVDLAQLKTGDDLARLSRYHRFPAMVDAGFVLSLNTPAEIDEKVKTLAAGRASVEAAERQRLAAAENDEYGQGVAEAWKTGGLLPHR